MSPVGINGVDKQGVGINGVQVKQALNPANETVAKGVYDATTLSAVDADLAVGNIALAVNIFGFVGTVAPGGAETVEMVSDAILGVGANYTPGVSGIFAGSVDWAVYLYTQYFSTTDGVWYKHANLKLSAWSAVGDGANFRLLSGNGGCDYIIFRDYIDSGTYERESDADLGAGVTYTPADSGVFSLGSEGEACVFQVNFGVLGWTDWHEYTGVNGQPCTVVIGDGARLRVINNAGGNRQFVLMRAVMS